MRPLKGAYVTELQHELNQAMSAEKVSVESVFGDIINYFMFLDFKKNLKFHLSAVENLIIRRGE